MIGEEGFPGTAGPQNKLVPVGTNPLLHGFIGDVHMGVSRSIGLPGEALRTQGRTINRFQV